MECSRLGSASLCSQVCASLSEAEAREPPLEYSGLAVRVRILGWGSASSTSTRHNESEERERERERESSRSCFQALTLNVFNACV